MSKWYIGADTGSKALAHYAKGASAKDHKWKTRSLRNGHWVYVYNDSKSGDSDSNNLDRIKNQTEQRKSMNAQAENERNKVAEAKEDRERRSDQYWQERDWAIEGYYKLIESMTGKDIRDVSNFYDVDAKKTKKHQPGGKEPDSWATLTDKKTGKTFTVPSFEEYYQIAKKNKDASNKNAVNGIQQKYAEIQKSQKQKMLKDANNKNTVSSIQQKYGSLTKGNAPVSNTPKVSKEYLQEREYNSRKNVFPEGFKTRPATAADADLFKNKSSAETKNKVTISDHGGNTGIKTEVTKKKKKRL